MALNYKMGRDASLSIFGSISLQWEEILYCAISSFLHYLILINLVKTDEDGSESWLLGTSIIRVPISPECKSVATNGVDDKLGNGE